MTEKYLKSIIREGVWDALKNVAYKVSTAGYRDDEPKSYQDVISGNGWTIYRTFVDNEQKTIIAVCRDRPLMRYESLPFEDLVDDLNVYFEDHNPSMKAIALDRDKCGYTGRGELIKIKK